MKPRRRLGDKPLKHVVIENLVGAVLVLILLALVLFVVA